MDIITYSHRNANSTLDTDPDLRELWEEVKWVLTHISDEEIVECFENENRKAKSISEAINRLIKIQLINRKWNYESPIFADPNYDGSNGIWRLDFAKRDIALEIAFNHGGNCSWNLIKPVLSSELNHVVKAIQTKIGIIICATDDMKKAGGFDAAVGSYEKYIEYLAPLNNILVTPLLIVGLKSPKTFKIEHYKEDNRKIGKVVRI
jgi:hypothetical protein